MIVLGNNESTTCAATITGDKLSISGRASGFLGYKVESGGAASGKFVEWETRNGCLEIRNDPLGFLPVFYRYDSCSFSFSTSICDLLTKDTVTELDAAAVAVFLRTGTYLADRTPFRSIRVMPPGSQIRFDQNGCTIVAPERPICGSEMGSLGNAHARYGELFEAAIERFRDLELGRIAVPLSGGRDSRHILFELARARVGKIECITVKALPHAADGDLTVAARVAHRVSMPHVVVGPIKGLCHAERRKNRLTSFCSLEHAWILPLADHMAAEGFDAVFDGIGGDVLSQSKNLSSRRLELYRFARLEELADEILGGEGYLPVMLSPHAYQLFSRAAAKDLVITELAKYVDAPNPVGQFFFWNRTRRNIASSSWGILSQFCPTFTPYLDLDLYQYLSSLPGEFLLGRRFHDEVIAERYPAFADLGYDNGEGPLVKLSHRSRYTQIGEWSRYFLRDFVPNSLVRPSFVYPRLMKSLGSSMYYRQLASAFTIPLYLNELTRLSDGAGS